MISNSTADIMDFVNTAHNSGKCCLLYGTLELREQALCAMAADKDCQIVNVSQVLAEALLEGEAPSPRVFASTLSGGSVSLLSHIELLFLPSLQLNPLEFLVRLARSRPVCISWPGTHANRRLRYASAEHPECFDDSDRKAIVVDLFKRKNE